MTGRGRDISNRVEEIRQITTKESWRHCPGKLNPADLPSQGVTAKGLRHSSLWWNGPQFLQHPENEWPENIATNKLNEDASSEVRKSCPNVVHVLSTAVSYKSNLNNLEGVFKVSRFSSFSKLLLVTVYVFRFLNQLKLCRKNHHGSQSNNIPIASEEISSAEVQWIKAIQTRMFSEEVQFLQGSSHTKPARVNQFGLFMDVNISQLESTMIPLSSILIIIWRVGANLRIPRSSILLRLGEEVTMATLPRVNLRHLSH